MKPYLILLPMVGLTVGMFFINRKQLGQLEERLKKLEMEVHVLEVNTQRCGPGF